MEDYVNHFYYITLKEFDNIFLDGVIQWCVDFLLKCQLGCPAVEESNHLGQHVWCTLACAHISLFGSHNNPISSQGKDRSRITYVSTGEEPEFRKVKLFSHVIHITGNRALSPAQSLVVFLMYQTMSVCFQTNHLFSYSLKKPNSDNCYWLWRTLLGTTQ